jgi:hypothetical protein
MSAKYQNKHLDIRAMKNYVMEKRELEVTGSLS